MRFRRIAVGSSIVLLACFAPALAQEKKGDTVPELIKKLQSPFGTEVTAAAKALEKLGPEARPAVPALAAALQKANFGDERVTLARTLGAIGPGAKDAVPALERSAH